MKILGIDPGIENIGYVCLAREDGSYKILYQGVLTPPLDSSYPEKLRFLFEELKNLLERLRPDRIAVEEILIKKPLSHILKAFQVQGLVLLLAGIYNIEVKIINPTALKGVISQHGRASKRDIIKALKILFDNGVFEGDTLFLENHHVADALALAFYLGLEPER